MSDSPLTWREEQEGQIGRLILNRPKANIIDGAMTRAIREQIALLADRKALKLIVFEGAGSHFSFGASVEEHRPEQVEGMLTTFHALFRELEATSIPTGAIVRGQCLGGGAELALFCGRVFCEPSAQFGLPEVKLGVFPPIGAMLLPWRVGGGLATQMILTGESISGERAASEGLVESCSANAEEALQTWFNEHLKEKSAVALRHAWRAVRWPLSASLDHHLADLERIYLKELMRHTDPVEGITAFLERRSPKWSHR